jgi:multiple sugar transport system substrate-binding protein
MVNWPYVWAAAEAAVHDRELSAATLADIGWARYPRVDPARESRPPLGGINLGIGAWSPHSRLALAAARCITSTANQTYYFLHDGNPSALQRAFHPPAKVTSGTPAAASKFILAVLRGDRLV